MRIAKYHSFPLHLSLVLLLIACGCFTRRHHSDSVAEKSSPRSASTETFDYDHKLMVSNKVIAVPDEKQFRVAVRRFGDTKPLKDSPFGRARSRELAVLDTETNTIKKVTLSELVPDIAPVLFTEKLTDALVQSGSFKVVERPDIETILRELEFENESRKVGASKAVKSGELEGVDLLLAGRYGVNDRYIEWIIEMSNTLLSAHLDSPNGKVPRGELRDYINDMIESQPPTRVLILRAYRTETGEVIASTTVEGETDSSLVNSAVVDLANKVYRGLDSPSN